MTLDGTETLRLSSWIHGSARTATGSDATLEVIDPWRGDVAAVLECGGEHAVTQTVQSAKSAFQANLSRSRAERAQWLERAADLMIEVQARLVEQSIRMMGKPYRAAAFEIGRSAAFIRACARHLSEFGGQVVPLDSSPAGAGRCGFADRVPYGVIAAVTPFNAPANLLVQKVAPAIATGNAVVVKPSPEGAAVALEIAAQFEAAGLPPGLFQVVLGGADEALMLAAHPDVAVVTLTGGTAAGEALARAAGAKPFLGELGGNSANIVCADANVADAIARIVPSAFEASGQQCISTQRIIIEAPVYDEFVDGFVAAVRNLKAGDPADRATDLGPVVHARAADRIMSMIDEAKALGGRIITGPDRKGCMIEPTIIADVPRHARVVQEEIFGPVAVLIRASSVEEAIERANDCEFGLQAACFTSGLDTAFRMGRELRAGSVWINEASRFRLDTYPFGGFGKSGSGREGVKYAMEEYTTWKFLGIRFPERG